MLAGSLTMALAEPEVNNQLNVPLDIRYESGLTVKTLPRKYVSCLCSKVAAMLCSLGMSGVSKFVDISQPRLLKRGTHVVEI